jgi:membrane protease YdiL (CAAX protease family)
MGGAFPAPLPPGLGAQTPVMHPDHLPPRTALSRVLRVLHFPLLRLLWTLVLLALVTGTLFLLAPSLLRRDNVTPFGSLRNALVVSFTLWASVHLFEGKTLARALGLSLSGALPRFFRGFLMGAGLLTAVTGVLWLCGSYRLVGLGAGAGVRALGTALLLFFFVAVFEEVLFRGIFFRLLEEGLGTWAALALSALLFGFIHFGNPGATTLSAFAIALEAGVLLGAAYVATRSLWGPIGLHTAWNVFEGPVYGTRVSGVELPSLLDAHLVGPAWLTGGDFGPEAGLPAVVVGGALGILFLVLAARRGQLFTPHWLRRLLARLKAPRRTLQPLPGAAARPSA